jgi:ABC-type multidrug transport system permease subunit
VRWLLLKDLQILRRSPLLVALLIVYPVMVSVLIGLALSRGPDKPRVAIVNEVPPDDRTFQLGGQEVDAGSYAQRLYDAVDAVQVGTRAEAVRMVRDGQALGALIIPADITQRLQDAVNLSGSSRHPTLEVVYNGRDPLKQQVVEATIKSRLADANAALSRRLTAIAAGYLDILLKGGQFSLLGQQLRILGLERSHTVLDRVAAQLPNGSPQQRGVREVSDFASMAIQNLGLSNEVLSAIGNPLSVHRTVLDGRRTPLDRYAVAVAVTVSLMFVTVLVGSGMLALEREEHTFRRLVRGLVSRLALLGEKVVLAAGCALGVTVVMLAGISLFVDLDARRAGWWALALGFGAVAFAALGVAIGALAREVRAASLLAFGLALPMAFLALVPEGAVSTALYDVVRALSAIFPFRAALEAMDAALNGGAGAGPPASALVHLAVLAIAYVALGRVALRRFA